MVMKRLRKCKPRNQTDQSRGNKRKTDLIPMNLHFFICFRLRLKAPFEIEVFPVEFFHSILLAPKCIKQWEKKLKHNICCLTPCRKVKCKRRSIGLRNRELENLLTDGDQKKVLSYISQLHTTISLWVRIPTDFYKKY